MTMSTGKRVALGSLAAAVAAGTVVVLLDRSPQASRAVEIARPTSAELEDFAGARILFAHQSVGANILSGVESLYRATGEAPPSIVETSEAGAAGTGGQLAHAHVGVNGDPLGKFAAFEALLDSPPGDEAEVALLKLCYADITAGTDVEQVFDNYVALMDGLQQRHPDLTLVYSTVPLTTDRSWKAVVKSWVGIDDQMGPADNLARQRYNTMIRQRYGESGRLFDIAALESAGTSPAMSRQHEGETFFVLDQALSSDAGHLNEAGSLVAAAELVKLIAGTLASQ